MHVERKQSRLDFRQCPLAVRKICGLDPIDAGRPAQFEVGTYHGRERACDPINDENAQAEMDAIARVMGAPLGCAR